MAATAAVAGSPKSDNRLTIFLDLFSEFFKLWDKRLTREGGYFRVFLRFPIYINNFYFFAGIYFCPL